jgi:hypothetical protein
MVGTLAGSGRPIRVLTGDASSRSRMSPILDREFRDRN